MELFLHIGSHKTGSTALQKTLFTHRKKLLRNGILYPEIALIGEGHHQLSRATGWGGHAHDPALIEQWIQHCASQCRKHRASKLVLSSESLSLISQPAALRGFTDYFDTTIVMYCRPQEDYLEAQYNQHVKMYRQRFSGSIYDFADKLNIESNRSFSYLRILDAWAGTFGQSRVLLRAYTRSANIVDDFLALLGAAELAGELPQSQANPGLHQACLPYVAHINQLQLDEGQHRRIVARAGKLVPKIPGSRLLTPGEATSYRSHFEQGNREAFARYGSDGHCLFTPAAGDRQDWPQIRHDLLDLDLLMSIVNAALWQDS